jgi:hypothetical protein
MRTPIFIKRIWYVAVDPAALDSSPSVRQYAEMSLDLAIAASVPSLTETRDEIHRISLEARQMMSEYDEKSRGFHRSAMYKGRMLAFEDLIKILAREEMRYDEKIAANKSNTGKLD